MIKMSSKKLINEYRYMIAKDGQVTKEELIGMLKLDDSLSDDNIKPETLNNLADEILEKVVKVKKEDKPKIDRKEINNKRMDLYNQGLNDYEMADIEGSYSTTIRYWRMVNKLPINVSRQRLELIEISDKRKELYNQGLKDREIADITNSTIEAIRSWRLRNKLPNNKKKQ